MDFWYFIFLVKRHFNLFCAFSFFPLHYFLLEAEAFLIFFWFYLFGKHWFPSHILCFSMELKLTCLLWSNNNSCILYIAPPLAKTCLLVHQNNWYWKHSSKDFVTVAAPETLKENKPFCRSYKNSMVCQNFFFVCLFFTSLTKQIANYSSS